MKLRRLRQARKGRIEIIPMIDVMFFLLATFIVASLAMQNLHSVRVNLPKGMALPLRTSKPVTLTVTRANRLFIGTTPVTLATLAATLKPLLHGKKPSVIVNADRGSLHGVVTEAMIQARQAGAAHFLIAITNVH